MKKTPDAGGNAIKVKQAESDRKISPEESELIESLFKYPSLEKVFGGENARQLPLMKQKMRATVGDLERVIRRGSKADAEKAAKVAEAYQITLNFLEELEIIRQA